MQQTYRTGITVCSISDETKKRAPRDTRAQSRLRHADGSSSTRSASSTRTATGSSATPAGAIVTSMCRCQRSSRRAVQIVPSSECAPSSAPAAAAERPRSALAWISHTVAVYDRVGRRKRQFCGENRPGLARLAGPRSGVRLVRVRGGWSPAIRVVRVALGWDRLRCRRLLCRSGGAEAAAEVEVGELELDLVGTA